MQKAFSRWSSAIILLGLAGAVLAIDPPPISFLPISSGTTSNLYRIAIGNDVYVAAGDESLVSTNGVDWQKLPISASTVLFANNRFVMLDTTGLRTHASTNGFDWITHELGASSFGSLVGGAGGFLLQQSDVVGFSTDGINWTMQTLPAPQGFTSVSWSGALYGNGRFVIHGSSRISSLVADIYDISTDGVTWTTSYERHFAIDPRFMVGFVYGYFYAMEGTVAYRSADLSQWTYFNSESYPLWPSMDLIGGRIVRSGVEGASFTRGSGADSYNAGVPNKLYVPVYDGNEYLFPGTGGIILKTQGAPALASLRINSAINGMIQFTAIGNAGWSYGLVQIPGSPNYPNTFPTSSVLDFTLPGTSTNIAIPVPATSAYFRLIER